MFVNSVIRKLFWQRNRLKSFRLSLYRLNCLKNSYFFKEEELEINDFPQQARWRITSKETISHICEYAEVGITVRGTYFPPGSKEPTLGERKLYLAIESLNDKGLSLVKSEISRIIKEELNKMSNPAMAIHQAATNKGRYKIV